MTINGKLMYIPRYTKEVLDVLHLNFDPVIRLTGAELGIASGVTAEVMLQAFPFLMHYMVDRCKQGELRQDIDQLIIQAKKRTEFARERRVLIIAHSVDAARLIPDGSLDFVFIDANHFYEWVMRDLVAWDRKVKQDGVLIGHDYNCPHEAMYGRWGVKKAVDEFCEDKGYKVCVREHHVWWARKS